ncbi:MAG: hypothetical protein SGPRY_008455, partial [Prymnesium sp.]
MARGAEVVNDKSACWDTVESTATKAAAAERDVCDGGGERGALATGVVVEGRYTLRSLASSRPTVIGATQSIRVRRYTGRGGDGSQISLTSTAPKRDSSSSGARARVRHRCCRCACGLVKGGASFVDGITAPQPPLRHRINDHRCLVRAPNARFTETGHLQCVRPVLATDLGAARHLEDLTAREVFVDYEAGGLGYWRLFDGLSVLQTSPRVKISVHIHFQMLLTGAGEKVSREERGVALCDSWEGRGGVGRTLRLARIGMASEELRLLRNQVPSLQAEAARLREAAVACQ